MPVLTKKVGTLKRVVRERGVSGVTSVLKEKAAVFESLARQAGLAPSALAAMASHGRPGMFINFGVGIGDDLLSTVMFRELRRRDNRNLWVMSRHPQVFLYNDDIEVVIPHREGYDTFLRRLKVKVVIPHYTGYNPAYDRDDPHPEQHIISIMCQKAGITGEITLKPHLTLHESEREQGQVVPRQIAIQSSGRSAKHAMTTKDWFMDGYHGVVSSLKSKYDFVQLGSPSDPPIDGARDLRGKTTLRETAAILSCSLAFVGQVGFLMHLARAVDCRSVVLYGGREHPSQSGYSCNENLYSAVACSPCWRLNSCPYDRECMRRISFADVVSAVEAQVARHGTPLAVDTATITQEQIDRNAVRYAEAVKAHKAAWSLLYGN